MSIPEVKDLEKLSSILEEVAERPQEEEMIETVPYLISFLRYNEKVCEISLLGKNKPKLALEYLKNIGLKMKSMDDIKNNMTCFPVRCEGDYKKLFNRLDPAVEMHEIKLQADSRIFFFIVEPERVLYVVALTENHLETDKNRR